MKKIILFNICLIFYFKCSGVYFNSELIRKSLKTSALSLTGIAFFMISKDNYKASNQIKTYENFINVEYMQSKNELLKLESKIRDLQKSISLLSLTISFCFFIKAFEIWEVNLNL